MRRLLRSLETKEHHRSGGGLYEHRGKQLEHGRGKSVSTASGGAEDLAEVLIVIVDLQVSTKVLDSDLTAR